MAPKKKRDTEFCTMNVSTMINFHFRSLQQFALRHVSHSHTWIIHFFFLSKAFQTAITEQGQNSMGRLTHT